MKIGNKEMINFIRMNRKFDRELKLLRLEVKQMIENNLKIKIDSL
mgnify:CR=1 FL=1